MDGHICILSCSRRDNADEDYVAAAKIWMVSSHAIFLLEITINNRLLHDQHWKITDTSTHTAIHASVAWEI